MLTLEHALQRTPAVAELKRKRDFRSFLAKNRGFWTDKRRFSADKRRLSGRFLRNSGVFSVCRLKIGEVRVSNGVCGGKNVAFQGKTHVR